MSLFARIREGRRAGPPMDAGRNVCEARPFISCGLGFDEDWAAEEELGRGEVTSSALCESSGVDGCSPTLAMAGGARWFESSDCGCV